MNVKILGAKILQYATIALWICVVIGILAAIGQQMILRKTPEIVNGVVESLPYRVNCENIVLHIFEPSPCITIGQVSIFDKQTNELLFASASVKAHIAVWESIKRRTLIFSYFSANKAYLNKKNVKLSRLGNDSSFASWLIFFNQHVSPLFTLHMHELFLSQLSMDGDTFLLKNLRLVNRIDSKKWNLHFTSNVSNQQTIARIFLTSNINVQTLIQQKKVTGDLYLKAPRLKLKYISGFKFLKSYFSTLALKQDNLKTELWCSFRDSMLQTIYMTMDLENLNTSSHPHKWAGRIYIKRNFNHLLGAIFDVHLRNPDKSIILPPLIWTFNLSKQNLPVKFQIDNLKVLHSDIDNTSQLNFKRLDNNKLSMQVLTHFQTHNIPSTYNYIHSFFKKFFEKQNLKILKSGKMHGEILWKAVLLGKQLKPNQFHARAWFNNLKGYYNEGPLISVGRGVFDTNLKNYQVLVDSGQLNSIQFKNVQANFKPGQKNQLAITGLFDRQPFTLTVDQFNQWWANHSVTAYIKGSIDPNYLLKVDQHVPIKFRGTALYAARLKVNFDKNEWALFGHSNLLGVRVIVPNLYLKTEDEVLPATFQINSKNHLVTFNMKLRERVIALLEFYKEQNHLRLFKGGINLGPGEAHLPQERGLFVDANITRLHWSHLQKFLTTLSSSIKSKTGAATHYVPQFLKQLRVHIIQFDLLSNPINQLHVLIKFLPKVIQASLNSTELVGQLTVSKNIDTTKVIGKFQKLELKNRLQPTNEKSEIGPSYFKNLTHMALDLHINHLKYGVLHFDKLKISATPFEGRLKINELLGENETFSIAATGVAIDNSKKSLLKLRGKILANDVGALLSQWNLTSRLQKGEGEGTFKFIAERPLEKSKKYTGQLHIKVLNGIITQLTPRIQSTVKWGEFLNALDLTTLWKKIFSEPKVPAGLLFNTLEGSLSFTNQRIKANHLSIDSDIAQINTIGEIDLSKHSYDIYLQVNPYLTSSLPVVLGTVGTPLLGGAAFIANKALEPWISQKMQHDYHLTGTY